MFDRAGRAGLQMSTESVRWGLLQSVEAAYYTGPTAGQPWLPQVSAFVDGLPGNDRRLVQLAIIGRANALQDFITVSPPATTEEFEPATWLDGYVGWAASLQSAAARNAADNRARR